MSEADKMFEELGYRITLNNDKTIKYNKQSDYFKYVINFDKREFAKTFEAMESIWVANDSNKWATQKFKSEWEKYCSANGYWSNMWHSFTMQELQAINQKCEELGWL